MLSRVIGGMLVALLSIGCFDTPRMDEDNPLDPLGSAYRPPAPTTVTAHALSEVVVGLNWEDRSSWESGFRVERRVGVNLEIEFSITLPPNTTSYTDSVPVTLFRLYTYRVAAMAPGSTLHYGKEVTIRMGLPGAK